MNFLSKRNALCWNMWNVSVKEMRLFYLFLRYLFYTFRITGSKLNVRLKLILNFDKLIFMINTISIQKLKIEIIDRTGFFYINKLMPEM